MISVDKCSIVSRSLRSDTEKGFPFGEKAVLDVVLAVLVAGFNYSRV